MSKASRQRKNAAREKLQHCGHASRYRNKLGCVKCRRENGATMAGPPRERRFKLEQAQTQDWHEDLLRAAEELSLDLSGVRVS